MRSMQNRRQFWLRVWVAPSRPEILAPEYYELLIFSQWNTLRDGTARNKGLKCTDTQYTRKA